ncbi:hypothetical protein J3R30DRAFT_3712065 [Lentinula aciculospora]|uniref:Uncharacterized protein n=1 Tax=Lentinula aciculospora TaxID=153920 RepID=A0A9W8ZYG1_9AGAR|nr:hypothetical protein J3R30DRAFT_3712065 [Lentinula aciculospora]
MSLSSNLFQSSTSYDLQIVATNRRVRDAGSRSSALSQDSVYSDMLKFSLILTQGLRKLRSSAWLPTTLFPLSFEASFIRGNMIKAGLLQSDSKQKTPATLSRACHSIFLAEVLVIGFFIFPKAANVNANAILQARSELGYGASLERRIQNATCQAGYDWADNAAGNSPCVTAAAVFACSVDPHNIPPLSPGDHYNPPSPSNDSVNACQCSWAAYNLISMCTICQGFGQTSSLFPWVSYSFHCGNFTQTNSYFPSSYSSLLPSDASIPRYAQTDRKLSGVPDISNQPSYMFLIATQWLNAVFNVTQAQGIVNGTYSLITSTSSSSKPTAAIIGGSIGGAVVLLCFFGMLFWLHKRNASRHKGRYEIVSNHSPPPQSVHQSIISTNNHSNTSGNHGSSQNSHPASFINDYSGSLGHSEDSTQNIQVPRPYRKSYNHNYNDVDNVYARPLTDLVVQVRRLTALAAQDPHTFRQNTQTGRYTTLPHVSALQTEMSTVADSSNPRRHSASNPPPYSSPIAEENSAIT